MPRLAAYGSRGHIPPEDHGHEVGPKEVRAGVVKGRLVTGCGVAVVKVEPLFTAEVRELPDSGTLGLPRPFRPHVKVKTAGT